MTRPNVLFVVLTLSRGVDVDVMWTTQPLWPMWALRTTKMVPMWAFGLLAIAIARARAEVSQDKAAEFDPVVRPFDDDKVNRFDNMFAVSNFETEAPPLWMKYCTVRNVAPVTSQMPLAFVECSGTQLVVPPFLPSEIRSTLEYYRASNSGIKKINNVVFKDAYRLK